MLEKYLTSLKPEETILVRSRDWPCHHAWHGQEYGRGKYVQGRAALQAMGINTRPCCGGGSARHLHAGGDSMQG